MYSAKKCTSLWKNHLNQVIHAYKCTKQAALDFSYIFSCFHEIPFLPIDVSLQTDTDPTKGNFSEYLESWKRGTKDAFVLAFKDSTARKTKNVERKLYSGPCLGDLKSSDHVLIRRLTPRGGSGRLRLF